VTTPPRRFRDFARVLGPGLVVAATGVGAGDLVAASKAGAAYGLPILWVAVVGAVLKFALAEGIARWQLATGTTVLEGWAHTFPRPVRIVFLVYLVLWTFIVGAALMSACGLAGHALVPGLSVRTWAVLHSLVGLGFVWFEGYRVFETVMKVAVAVMVVAIVGAAALEAPPLGETVRGLIVPDVPSGSLLLLLGVVGGVGGSVTLLSYNYWLAEKRWAGRSWLAAARVDLGVGYVLTGVFGVAMIILAGMILLPRGLDVAGSRGLLDLAAVLGERFGRVGELVFLIGFWGAVASSLLGVWQSVPYLFADAWGLERTGEAAPETSPPLTRTRPYRGYLLYLALAPMLLLLIDRPVWLVVVYAAVGSLFMPFLAGTLLVMNNRRPILGSLRNGPVANVTLGLCLALFAYLGVREILEQIGG
jgi:Mn2+/Fe2+ NRAMP family transporter